METSKNVQTEQITDSDLSEQIKLVTKDSHTRAENTELMLSYQRGHVSLTQYQMLLCSLYKIYEALEEALDRNATHDAVAPIYFPQELERLPSIRKDLEHFYGQSWREKISVPAATLRYVQRLRQVGSEHPEYLVAHAYTRYLGDLSGGQVLGRITQKSLGLKNGEGLSFFSFPAVSSPTLFKQLYRSRMNSLELTEEQRRGVLEEAVAAFQLNIQVFNELQDSVCETDDQNNLRLRRTLHKDNTTAADVAVSESSVSSLMPQFVRTLLGLFVVLAVGLVYVF
ncbi:heme oxygenase-like [Triplophysa dalaica]|uniref:heme oxygenase-like n=1 Tax=Triplophysa dalaica TaxID=1582913 RepID=UPI0024DF42B4|nr:heme oxygenase-like [Triplophysa dalaica]